MRTVVYQSFRTKNVPDWIATCIDSVKTWAQVQGFEYRFFDDGFFDLVPAALRPRASEHKCILADYARLVAARDLLKEGWDRAIWIDADAVVFAPKRFTIPISEGYAFCREVWLDRIAYRNPHFNLTVNNSVSVFCQDQKIIDFYLDAANAVLRSNEPLTALSIGTDFLLKLQRARRFPLLTHMGIFGPEMAYRYMRDEGRFLQTYLNFQTSPIYAANLCLSHQGVPSSSQTLKKDWGLNERTLLEFIARLRSDEGESLNRWFSNGYKPNASEFDRPLSRYLGIRRAFRSLLFSLQNR